MTETLLAPLAPKMTPTSAPFWAALGEWQVVLQQCDGCGAWVFYPRPRCPHCLSAALSWKPVSGRATLPPGPTAPAHGAALALAPQTLAVVTLEEGAHRHLPAGNGRADPELGMA